MRLIDADKLIELIDDDISTLDIIDMSREGYDVCLCTLKMVKQYIKALPTAEPIKHGRWIKDNGNWWHCSECGQQIFSMSEYDRNKFHKWCGSCGARMDAQIGEDKSHPFAESVMMGMDEVTE